MFKFSTDIEKAQKQQERLNQKFILSKIDEKQKRHVKEKNEPVLDEIISNFSEDYAKLVVSKSMLEIIKEIKNV